MIGYDTLYAIQDIEDDELVGVKSSARAMGDRAQLGVGICYVLALAGWSAAIWSVRPDWLALLALLPAAIHLARQVARTEPRDGAGALALFRSNRFTWICDAGCGSLLVTFRIHFRLRRLRMDAETSSA